MARGARLAIYLTLLFIAALPLAYSAPPVFLTEQAGSLSVQYPKIEYYSVGVPFDLHFHVFNDSGVPVTNITTNCTLHLYNGTNNEHILKIPKLAYDGNEFEAEGLVFNESITVAYIAYCVQGSKGGYTSSSIRVSATGYDDQNQDLTPFTTIAFTPFIISILFFAAAYYFRNDEDHKVYAFGMYLFSLVFVLAGFAYSIYLTSTYYYNNEISDFTSTLLWVYIVFIGLIIAYWVLYLIKTGLDYARKKRNGDA